MRVQPDIWLVCTFSWLTQFITNSEVGFKFSIFSFCCVCFYHILHCVYINVSDRLLPDQRGALWLCLMQYCESCTSPRTPEYLLYMYHTHLRSLPWKHLHPDTQLMEQFFNVRHFDTKLLISSYWAKHSKQGSFSQTFNISKTGTHQIHSIYSTGFHVTSLLSSIKFFLALVLLFR